MNRIGQNIVKNSDCKVPFTIKVIDSDEINAMALPGGFFYVNSGLILNADEEAELAGVMAHETAHVCAHHAVREQTRMNYAQLGTIPLIMMTGYSWTGYGIYEATQFAVPLTFLKFSRDFEAQADYLGIQYMYRSGYDPQAFISFFEKVQALEKRKPGLVAKAFSDHPQTPDRISPLAGRDRQYSSCTRRIHRHDLGVRRRQGPPRPYREQAPPPRHQGQEQALPAPRQHHRRQERPGRAGKRRRRPSDAPSPRRPESIARLLQTVRLGHHRNAAQFWAAFLFLRRDSLPTNPFPQKFGCAYLGFGVQCPQFPVDLQPCSPNTRAQDSCIGGRACPRAFPFPPFH